jgi:hypothetical protein
MLFRNYNKKNVDDILFTGNKNVIIEINKGNQLSVNLVLFAPAMILNGNSFLLAPTSKCNS